MPDATELLAARLARMKALIEDLERVCSESVQQREGFKRLHDELEATRRAIEPYKP